MLKVKKLKIAGFKSIAFPTEIEIGEGVTGIVGPNGCGKSNVFESIRWVMGESSSKSLRSNSMDEVIFNGTDNVPAKNYAEVTLELENIKINESYNNVAEDKIKVSRSIERGIGSFYKINNKDFGESYTLSKKIFLDCNSHLLLCLGEKFGELNIISNIKDEDLIKLDLFRFNPKDLEILKIVINEKNGYDIYSSYNSIFRDFRMNISNNYSSSDFIFDNKEELPVINRAINYLYKKN